jgi:hypothetical protein
MAMLRPAHPAYFAIFVLLVAPLGAVVLISALMLFGIAPRAVFAPGWAVKSLFEARGAHVPNAVGVATTVALWWLLIVAVGAAWERFRR